MTPARDVYVGDNLTVDQTHTSDAFDVAGFAREVEGRTGALKMYATGDPLLAQARPFGLRAVVIARAPGSTVGTHVNLGANEVGSATLQDMIAALTSLIAAVKAANPAEQVHSMTISPHDDGDGAAAPGNRAAFNAAIRAGLPGADAFYDFDDRSGAPNGRDTDWWGGVDGRLKHGGGLHSRWFDAVVRDDLLTSRRVWRAAVT